ncbi:MAG TPA: hypothetical protein VHX16_16080, partial [Chloroflexota bacterium]|nr:hypothetical protein [Chloroflexota bacterium]
MIARILRVCDRPALKAIKPGFDERHNLFRFQQWAASRDLTGMGKHSYAADIVNQSDSILNRCRDRLFGRASEHAPGVLQLAKASFAQERQDDRRSG